MSSILKDRLVKSQASFLQISEEFYFIAKCLDALQVGVHFEVVDFWLVRVIVVLIAELYFDAVRARFERRVLDEAPLVPQKRVHRFLFSWPTIKT